MLYYIYYALSNEKTNDKYIGYYDGKLSGTV